MDSKTLTNLILVLVLIMVIVAQLAIEEVHAGKGSIIIMGGGCGGGYW